MEMFLICMFDMRLVGKDVFRAQLSENPNLGFPYDFLHYEPLKNMSVKLYNNEQTVLSNDDIEKIENFIKGYRFKVYPIAPDGTCGEETFIDEVTGPYAHCRPPRSEDHYWYNPEALQWDYIYGVDSDGHYIGNVPFTQCAGFATYPTIRSWEVWDNTQKKWVDPRSLDDLKAQALAALRIIANNSRGYSVLFMGHIWKSTEEDLAKLNTADDSLTSWEDSFGDSITLDGFTIPDLRQAIRDYWAVCEERYEIAASKVAAAPTAEALAEVFY